MADNAKAAYLEARKMISANLKEKYPLIESFSSENRLSLSNENYTIHFTFSTPEGEEVYLSKKGEMPMHDNSFMHFVVIVFPEIAKMKKALQEMFSGTTRSDYSKNAIFQKLSIQINFLEVHFPDFFV